jgi:hypothetical protein
MGTFFIWDNVGQRVRTLWIVLSYAFLAWRSYVTGENIPYIDPFEKEKIISVWFPTFSYNNCCENLRQDYRL